MTECAEPYRRPRGIEWDELEDARWDLMDNEVTTLPGTHDPVLWIYWLERFSGLDQVTVMVHTDLALILRRF